jgi:hypothetical protein
MATAPKHFQPALCLVVADVDERDEQRADQGQRAGDEEAAVDRLEGVGLALLRLHGEDAGDRGDDADRPGRRAGRSRPSAGLAPIELKAATPRMIDATRVTS